jgi:hypothetical protein
VCASGGALRTRPHSLVTSQSASICLVICSLETAYGSGLHDHHWLFSKGHSQARMVYPDVICWRIWPDMDQGSYAAHCRGGALWSFAALREGPLCRRPAQRAERVCLTSSNGSGTLAWQRLPVRLAPDPARARRVGTAFGGMWPASPSLDTTTASTGFRTCESDGREQEDRSGTSAMRWGGMQSVELSA